MAGIQLPASLGVEHGRVACDWPLGLGLWIKNRGGEMSKDPGAVTEVQPVPTAEGVSNPAEVGGREGVVEPSWCSALPSLSWVCDLGCGSGHS